MRIYITLLLIVPVWAGWMVNPANSLLLNTYCVPDPGAGEGCQFLSKADIIGDPEDITLR